MEGLLFQFRFIPDFTSSTAQFPAAFCIRNLCLVLSGITLFPVQFPVPLFFLIVRQVGFCYTNKNKNDRERRFYETFSM